MEKKYKVVIVQYRLLHYRVALFEKLKSECSKSDIDLIVVHGQPTSKEAKKKDVGFLAWANVVKNRYFDFKGRDILWQPLPRKFLNADLIILMQENRLLSNYPLLFKMWFRSSRVAYWGHGRNFQTNNPNGWRERWKKYLVAKADWWFAYTEMTRDILLSDGYSDNKITVLNNAIDNVAFQQDIDSVTDADLRRCFEEIGLDFELKNEFLFGVFCGSLYSDKKLDFMIEAADLIRSSVPNFRFIIIGDGPDSLIIRNAVECREWMHWVGVKKGKDKAAWFKTASVVLNPGLVGLHVLDSFCAGVPMVTTDNALHSPEIAYLENNVNGLVVPGDVVEYARSVVRLLIDKDKLLLMGLRAKDSAKRYTLDNMVANFHEGILRCVSQDSRK